MLFVAITTLSANGAFAKGKNNNGQSVVDDEEVILEVDIFEVDGVKFSPFDHVNVYNPNENLSEKQIQKAIDLYNEKSTRSETRGRAGSDKELYINQNNICRVLDKSKDNSPSVFIPMKTEREWRKIHGVEKGANPNGGYKYFADNKNSPIEMNVCCSPKQLRVCGQAVNVNDYLTKGDKLSFDVNIHGAQKTAQVSCIGNNDLKISGVGSCTPSDWKGYSWPWPSKPAGDIKYPGQPITVELFSETFVGDTKDEVNAAIQDWQNDITTNGGSGGSTITITSASAAACNATEPGKVFTQLANTFMYGSTSGYSTRHYPMMSKAKLLSYDPTQDQTGVTAGSLKFDRKLYSKNYDGVNYSTFFKVTLSFDLDGVSANGTKNQIKKELAAEVRKLEEELKDSLNYGGFNLNALKADVENLKQDYIQAVKNIPAVRAQSVDANVLYINSAAAELGLSYVVAPGYNQSAARAKVDNVTARYIDQLDRLYKVKYKHPLYEILPAQVMDMIDYSQFDDIASCNYEIDWEAKQQISVTAAYHSCKAYNPSYPELCEYQTIGKGYHRVPVSDKYKQCMKGKENSTANEEACYDEVHIPALASQW